MKTKIIALVLIAALGGLVAGCVETVDGRSQAGVPWLSDRVENRYDVPAARVFDAAKEVIAMKGTLTGENLINGSLEGKVNQNSVFVRVDEIDAAKPITSVIVQVRAKGGGTDIGQAHEIATDIALKLVHQ